MCDTGTCRPCRLEDRLLDRELGTKREYIETPRPPTREENYAKRGNVVGMGVGMLDGRKSKIARLREARRAERVEIDGRLVHPNAEHGSDQGYFYYGCRCVPCSGRSQYHRQKAKEKKAAQA